MDYGQYEYLDISHILDHLIYLGISGAPARGIDKFSRRSAKNNLRKKINKFREMGLSKTEAILDYIRIKREEKKLNSNQIYVSGTGWTQYYIEPSVSLADCTKACAAPTPCPPKSIGVKKEKSMRYDYDGNPIMDTKRDYLEGRLSSVTYELEKGLSKTFGLVDDEAPNSAKDLVNRITSGKFTFKDEKQAEAKQYSVRDALSIIRWRDPSVKEDEAGYQSAYELLHKERTKVNDTIAISDPKDGLAAVQALEAWKPTGAAN